MDNNKDRQFYWEVKDFMNKKANPQPSNPSKPKITDAVKNVLEQNNPYIQKSFNNKSEYIPHVQKTISIVSETEKGYEQNCKALTKNKDVNAFQTTKTLNEALVNVPGQGFVLQPSTNLGSGIGLAPQRSQRSQRQTARRVQEPTQDIPLKKGVEINPTQSTVNAGQRTAAQTANNIGSVAPGSQTAKNIGAGAKALGAVKGLSTIGTNIGLGYYLDTKMQPVLKDAFGSVFGKAENPNTAPGSKWNIDDSAELTSTMLSGAASGAIADVAAAGLGNLLAGKAVGAGLAGVAGSGALAGAAIPGAAVGGYQIGKAIGQSDLVQNAVANMYGMKDIRKTEGQTKEQINQEAEKIKQRAKHERMYGKRDENDLSLADVGGALATGGLAGVALQALKNPNKWLPDLSGFLPQ